MSLKLFTRYMYFLIRYLIRRAVVGFALTNAFHLTYEHDQYSDNRDCSQ